MKPETAERLAIAFDRAATQASGAANLEESVAEVTRFLEWLMVHLRRCASVEQVREFLLPLEEPDPAVLKLVLGTLRHAPRIVTGWIGSRAKKVATTEKKHCVNARTIHRIW